ncbi:MAG: type II toxin-antitoxin system VapC family toxin [Patescibacteria group bacterium]|nr:type II toxin-antitoxin system VapC family toxin [Patescibacteria group bacterium]MDP4031032.1 type II toxin-antitoxin system VapC family toxin [Candidatus Beckwithbacteria bacterium]MDZ4229136.1 type II toxin-antitoxin system VapC family toxin [Patescibacteria group bacterium]
MRYLLDTSTVVNFLRGKKLIDETVIKGGAAVSIITQAELFYGAIKSAQSKKNLDLVKGFIKDLEIATVNLSEPIILSYARLKTSLEKQGKKLDEFDLLIAASALENNLALVTDNARHFDRVKGLRIFSR